ncbi:MAG: efflux RND transporter periplasmic adaptor subunit, partial [Kiritimatiellae bacterium]|nr:efflux RND transporter periplasmic adaptor subunit [Kiritimatiellia bacterium]
HSEALLDLAKAQEKQAAVALEMAEKDEQDSFVIAPIDGVVSERMRELGEMAAPGSPVFRIVDNRLLDAAAFLPSEYYDRFAPGRAVVRLTANGRSLGEYPVTYRSPDINAKWRTFEMDARITDPPDFVAAGGMVKMQAIMERHEGLGVPRNAIQQRADKSVVFLVEGDTARQVMVKTGLETDGWIEVSGDGLQEGMPVVVSGQSMLNDGDCVELLNRAK